MSTTTVPSLLVFFTVRCHFFAFSEETLVSSSFSGTEMSASFTTYVLYLSTQYSYTFSNIFCIFFLKTFQFNLYFWRVLLNSCTSVPSRMMMVFYFLNALHNTFLAQYLALCAREY